MRSGGAGIRRSVVCSALILAACVIGLPGHGGADTARSAPPPAAPHEYTNVILISLQCLRPDHLGTYGYQRDTSRNIDAFARQSVVFENAIAQSNLTPVAQMSIMTSQYPRVHGMVSFEVAKDMVTQRSLPELLKLYGYTTAAFASSPEFFVRFDSASGITINTGDVFSRSFDSFQNTRRGLGRRNIRKIPDESLQWIRENKERKFFLWIASGLLHMPYGASVPLPHRARYDDPAYIPFWKRIPQLKGALPVDEDPSYEVLSRVYRGQFYWNFSPLYRLTDDDVRYVNARYDAGIFYTDLFIGELMQLLDSLNLSGRTLVVLHSSHGDDMGERGDFFHYDVSDGVVKQALIVRFPKREFAGRRIAGQVQGIDIMPTILSYLDIPVPHEAQGNDLVPLLHDERRAPQSEFVYIDRIPWWEYTLSKWYLEFQSGKGLAFAPQEEAKLKEYRERLQALFNTVDYPPGDIAIRSPEWKLILRKNRKLLNEVSWWSFITGTKRDKEDVELYHLTNDPLEQTNVAAQYPDVVAALKEKLLQWDAAMERRKAVYRKQDKRLIIPYP
jgi:arylsulfatase A-like enzyme